jgi:pilus assembly protein Flp/PilA
MFGQSEHTKASRTVLQTATHRSVSMKNLAKRFVKDESGATAIEYGLIAACIAIAIITAVKTVGNNLSSTFSNIAGNLH